MANKVTKEGMKAIEAEPMLRNFLYDHLPTGPLQDNSKKFCELAWWVAGSLPRTPERTVALRKLLEAKDAAVRTQLPPLDVVD